MLYSKAPITEATIDLRIAVPEDFALARLEHLQTVLDEGYSEKQNIRFDELLVQPEAHTTAHRSQQIGYRFVNADKRRIVQARMDGFAFSLLAPYERWETFSQEARRLWERFRDHIQPLAVTRLGVRYINRLDVPSPTIELKEYLATVPEIAEGLPQVLQRYFMQLVLPMEAIHATAIINQALVPPPIPDTTSIMLDIDLFRDQDVPQDEEGIWQAFGQLREGKNQIFNASLTHKAKGLIE
jgi:uncharacterized protein (TIGR04255 family)